MVHFNEEAYKRRTKDLLKREAVRVAQYLSAKHGIPYVDLTLTAINTEALGKISEEDAKKAKVAAYRLVGNRIDVAALSPLTDDVKAVAEDLKKKGFEPSIYITTTASLDRAWNFYVEVQQYERTQAGQIDIGEKDLGQFVEKMGSLAQTKQLITDSLAKEGTSRITSMLEIILSGAISLTASDVHIEPEEEHVRVRYRLDGILHEVADFDNHTYKLLASRIKLLSSLKLNVGSKRQDGRFSIKIGEDNIDIRTSIIPGAYGEAVVMRLLNPKAISMTISSLGINDKLLKLITDAIHQPNGMILTTGPTGSGKTTSLYAFLGEINKPGVKIITIEDPIEYHMAGAVQTQVKHDKGYTFFEGLKSAMRQDPDIIMVGEIRDEETAGTAIDAALTGHLVFSTLHTNNAAGTVPRLLDLMVNPKVIGPALSLSLAQRLVRRLCKVCKIKRAPNDEEREILERGIRELKFLDVPNIPDSVPAEVSAAKDGGCGECNNTGYRGRVGIYEGIVIDRAVEAIIPTNPSEYEIWQAAAPQKIPTMKQDGLAKIFEGLTTTDELSRVVNLRAPSPNIVSTEEETDKESMEPAPLDLPPLETTEPEVPTAAPAVAPEIGALDAGIEMPDLETSSWENESKNE